MINGSGAPARQILGNGVINGRCRTILARPPRLLQCQDVSPEPSAKPFKGFFIYLFFPVPGTGPHSLPEDKRLESTS